MKNPKEKTAIPKRRLGKTGLEVAILGLGGEGILRTFGNGDKASEVINTAIDLGVNYFESARAYDGSESYYGLALKERRKDIILSSKSHARDRKGALEHLHQTLKNMKTDYLDIWQIHDVRTEDDINRIFGPDGALSAFQEAKDKGLARFIGITGHQDPVILKRAIELFDFDTVLIPVNPAEPGYKSFLEEIIPVASAKDIGIIGMKVYLRGNLDVPKKLLFCYALTQPISTAVIGCDDIEQMNENAGIAADFFSLKYKEVQRLTQLVSPYARDLMYYKP